MMNQDEILQGTRSVVQSLETLRNEHANITKTLLDKLDSFKNEQLSNRTIVQEEIDILKNSNEMVQLGISEASVLIQLSNYSIFPDDEDDQSQGNCNLKNYHFLLMSKILIIILS